MVQLTFWMMVALDERWAVYLTIKQRKNVWMLVAVAHYYHRTWRLIQKQLL